MESDGGVFQPQGFAFAGSDSATALVRQAASLLESIGATAVEQVPESPEADIGPMVERGVPGIGLEVDGSRYFWYHHSRGRHAGQARSGGGGPLRRRDGGHGVRGSGLGGRAAHVQ